jgi:hypothetical protein
MADKSCAQRPGNGWQGEAVAGAEPSLTRRREHLCGVRQHFTGQRQGGGAPAIERGPVDLAHARVHADEDLHLFRHARGKGGNRGEIADRQDRALAARREALRDAGRDAKAREPARASTESNGIGSRTESTSRNNSSTIGSSQSA